MQLSWSGSYDESEEEDAGRQYGEAMLRPIHC